jgi:hypothetical protein
MSKTNKIPFPSWMIGILSVSAIALLAVAILVWQWIAWERIIANDLTELRLASSAVFQPSPDAAGVNPPKEPTDSPVKSQWKDVLSQIQHPYFKNQIDLFFEVPEINPSTLTMSPQNRPLVVWSTLPVSLAKFALANRPLLDSIHDSLAKSTDPFPIPATDFRQINTLGDLAFLDAASCLASEDKARFDKALESVYRISKQQFSRIGSELYEPLVCLMHRGLDENLISPQEASRWLDRLYKDSPATEGNSFNPPDRADLFRYYDAQIGNLQLLPSIRMMMFDQYYKEETMRSNSSSLYGREFENSLVSITLAVRVALINTIAQKPGHPEWSNNFAERLQIPNELRNFLPTADSLKLESYLIDHTTYEQKSATEGQLNFVLPDGVTSGRYPIGSTYILDIKMP